MKSILSVLAVPLAVCILLTVAYPQTAFAMQMDSAHTASALDSTSSSSMDASMLLVNVRDADTCYVATARLTSPVSGDGQNPIANTTVSFFVQRLFGKMPVAEENTATTDDSGIAEIVFPKNFPGDADGTLTLIALIEDNAPTGPLETRIAGKWGVPVPIVADAFPRALWEPNAPVAMILAFCILLGGVWITYGFVVSQIFHIKKGNNGSHAEI